MLKFVFLTDQFFCDHAQCSEIEKKQNRPHVQIFVRLNALFFCIPMRSNIHHPHVIWTDKENHCGIDFSKAVIVTDPDKYIDKLSKPHIRETEFKKLKRINEYEIERGMLKYIQKYKEAKQNLSIPRNRILVSCSSLQYFEKYI